MAKPETTPVSKLDELVRASGNDFHIRVVEALREHEWHTTISPYYHDTFSEKPRELDAVAEKIYSAKEHGSHEGWLPVRLFIECKYINQPTVFWFQKKDIESAEKGIVDTTPLRGQRENITILQHRNMRDEPVAKLFASAKLPEQEQMFKALTQSLNALTSMRKSACRSAAGRHGPVFRTLNYPVIVCSSFEQFYSREDGELKPITNNFQLEVSYAHNEGGKQTTEYFLVDVVDFSKLGAYLEDLETSAITLVANAHAWDHRRQEAERIMQERQMESRRRHNEAI